MNWIKHNEWLKPDAERNVRWRELRRFAANLWEFRTSLLGAAALAVLGSSAALLIPLIFRTAQRTVVSHDIRGLTTALTWFAAAMLIDVAATYRIRTIRASVSSRMNRRLALQYYAAILDAGVEDFIDFKQRTNLFQRLMDATFISAQFTDVLIRGGQAVVVVAVVGLVIAMLSPLVFGILVLGAALLFVYVVVSARHLGTLRRRLLALNYPLVGKMMETIGGLLTIKALAASLRVSSDIDGLVASKTRAEIDEGLADAKAAQIAQAIRSLTLIAAVGASFAHLIAGTLGLADVFAIYVLTGLLLQPIHELAMHYQTLARLSVNVKNYYEVVDLPREADIAAKSGRSNGVQARIDAATASVATAAVGERELAVASPGRYRSGGSTHGWNDGFTPHDLSVAAQSAATRQDGHIQFCGVDFAYRTGGSVLSGINLEIQPGEHVSLIGRSGAGKTTLVRVLLGFLQPQRGTVRVDGVDVCTVTDRSAYRRQFGVVSQHDVLFGTSLRENLAFGLHDPVSDSEVEETLRLVDLWADVERLDLGLGATYSEDLFSGGQKQRFCIARALLRHPSIVLLDEPTSALDFENEHRVLAALRQLVATKTSITIAHRLSTVRSSDRVIVLGGGRIQASGTHDALYESNQYYRELCEYNSFML